MLNPKKYPRTKRAYIKPKEPVTVVLSGGQDSTTCLFWALMTYDGAVHCITFDYGQRHSIELTSAVEVVHYARSKFPGRFIGHDIIPIPRVLQGTSPLVSDAPLEQYKDHASLPGGLEKTFVPMRNQFFLTVAANFAFVHGCSSLVTGVCQEDSGGYPDCRDEFIRAFERTASLGTFNAEAGFHDGLTVETPLMFLTKADSIRFAFTIPHAYTALALTHTAYDGVYPPTGKDHANLLREKGFAEAGVPDPLVLRAVDDGWMEMPNSENYGVGIVNRIKRDHRFPTPRRAS